MLFMLKSYLKGIILTTNEIWTHIIGYDWLQTPEKLTLWSSVRLSRRFAFPHDLPFQDAMEDTHNFSFFMCLYFRNEQLSIYSTNKIQTHIIGYDWLQTPEKLTSRSCVRLSRRFAFPHDLPFQDAKEDTRNLSFFMCLYFRNEQLSICFLC